MGWKASLISKLPSFLSQPIRKIYYFSLLKNFHQTDELLFLDELIKKGDFVVDVGASIGLYTQKLSLLAGSEGKVISIEPVPSTFDILKHNIKKFKLSNVIAKNYAISDVNGRILMETPSWPDGGKDFYRSRIVDQTQKSGKSFYVVSATLDNMLINFPQRVSFIKCDVEGSELKVIEGAINTIKKSMPSLLLEIISDPMDKHSDAYKIFSLLEGVGYQAFWLKGSSLEKYSPSVNVFNYFFIPNK